MEKKIVLHSYDDTQYEFDTNWLVLYLKKFRKTSISLFMNEYNWDDTETIVAYANQVGEPYVEKKDDF